MRNLLEMDALACGNGAVWSEELQAMHWPNLPVRMKWQPDKDDGAAARRMAVLRLAAILGSAK